MTLPHLWLISDARNDARLERAIARLPRGSGVIFRHYHLPEPERMARFAQIRRRARRYGHIVVLSGTMAEARRSGAQGAYGSPQSLHPGPRGLRLATIHSLRELAKAQRSRADAVLLSPVFPTRSHQGAPHLGVLRFRHLGRYAGIPVIALGGMTARAARAMSRPRGLTQAWAAIDGL